MTKQILVKTDDPNKGQFNLVVTGPVENVVDINPPTVSLSGAPGKVLEAEVVITPAEKYGFSILGLEQKFNTNIKAQLVKPEAGTANWKVKISSTSQKPDNFYDIITLKTDSKYKPLIQIKVYAIYLKETSTNS